MRYALGVNRKVCISGLVKVVLEPLIALALALFIYHIFSGL